MDILVLIYCVTWGIILTNNDVHFAHSCSQNLYNEKFCVNYLPVRKQCNRWCTHNKYIQPSNIYGKHIWIKYKEFVQSKNAYISC